MARRVALLLAAAVLSQATLSLAVPAAPAPVGPDKKQYTPANYVSALDNSKPSTPEQWAPPTAKDPFKDSYASEGPAGGYPTYPALTCSGHSYCFKRAVKPAPQKPGCSVGYTLDEKNQKCYKFLVPSCPKKTFPCSDPSICLKCPHGFTLEKESLCVKPCKAGHKAISVNGTKYCVQECESGYYPYGDKCISSGAVTYPEKCNGKCAHDEVFLGTPQAYAPSYTATAYADPIYGKVYLAYDNAVKAGYAKLYSGAYPSASYKQVQCRCAEAKDRSVYKQACEAPKKVASIPNIAWQEPCCADGSAPGNSGLCATGCPKGFTKNAAGLCECPCPHGYKECTYYGSKYCATKYNLFNCDSCDIMGSLWEHMDKGLVCPIDDKVVVPTPTAPANTTKVAVVAPKTSPAPPKAPVAKAPAATSAKATTGAKGATKATSTGAKATTGTKGATKATTTGAKATKKASSG